MRKSWTLACLLVVGACGRVGFDPKGVANDGDIGDSDATNGDGGATSIPLDPFPGIPDLVAWYSMEDDVAATSIVSASDPARDGTCSGSTCPVSVAGRVGSGLAFDATSVVIISNSEMIGTQPVTVSVWAYCTGSPSGNRIMVGKAHGPNTFRNVHALLLASGTLSYESTSGTGVQSLKIDGFDPFDAWHHYATVWDGTRKHMYVDGVFQDSIAATIASATEPILLGQDFDRGAYANPLVGTLDELRIYARALDPAEIAQLASE